MGEMAMLVEGTPGSRSVSDLTTVPLLRRVVESLATMRPGRYTVYLGRALHRAVDAQLLGVLAVQLSKQMNDPAPDVGRNQRDVAQAAFFDRAQQLIGLA